MNVKAIVLCLWPFCLQAQGFAGLGGDAEGFAVPQKGVDPVFPADHGPHPDYRIEWWYVTANLEDAAGNDYGVQWTLFRSALAPHEADGWASPQVWLGHAAVTTAQDHFATERYARGGIGQAGARNDRLEAWIDDWSLTDTRLSARSTDWGYDLSVTATGPLVLQGDDGYSVKSADGQASYYYSRPFMTVSGTLDLPDGPVQVTGDAWLDREWSSQPLSGDQSGWDWFSLSFDTGDKLMGFRLRGAQDYTSATWIEADGTAIAYDDGAFSAEPLQASGSNPPVRWRVRLPEQALDVTVAAMNPDAWMGLSIPYWEGPVTVDGTHSGRGYLEMTGYEAED